MARVLLVDDEPSILSVLSTLLKAEGHEVVSSLGGERAQELLDQGSCDLMVTDIGMHPINGMDLLRLAHDQHPGMPVIMLTAYGSIETAIEALKFGAFDYVTKPFKLDELLITVQRALNYSAALNENGGRKAQRGTHCHLENIVAESSAMQNVCDMIRRVAPTDATVLIYGESGTGKELVAKALHASSHRKDKKYLPVNCAALPEPLLESEMFGHVKGAFTGASSNQEGLFEAASGGTIFLDEIGSMPLGIQGKLLRVLQEKEVRRVGSNENIPVDARVLAATNSRLEEMLKEGSFREDLYYRLSVIPIEISPLRERPDDILPLVYHVIKQESKNSEIPHTISPEVASMLAGYNWPGNVRELENAIRHAITFAKNSRITMDVLPPKISHTASTVQGANVIGTDRIDPDRCKSLKGFLQTKEKEYLHQILDYTKGDKEKAAKALEISLATLYRKLRDEEHR